MKRKGGRRKCAQSSSQSENDALDYRGKYAVRSVLDAESAYLRRSGADDPYEPEIWREIVATKQLIDKSAK